MLTVLVILSICFRIMLVLIVVYLPLLFRKAIRDLPLGLFEIFHGVTIKSVTFDEPKASKDIVLILLGWARSVSYAPMFVFAGVFIVANILIWIPSTADWAFDWGMNSVAGLLASCLCCLLLEAGFSLRRRKFRTVTFWPERGVILQKDDRKNICQAYKATKDNLRKQADLGLKLAEQITDLKQIVDKAKPEEIPDTDKERLQKIISSGIQTMNCFLRKTSELFDRVDALAVATTVLK